MSNKKKVVAEIVLTIILSVLICTGIVCIGENTKPQEISRQAVDVKYTEAHDEIETTVEYTFDILNGGFVLVPITKTVHCEDKYEIEYLILYSNQSEKRIWQEVSKDEYLKAEVKINEGK